MAKFDACDAGARAHSQSNCLAEVNTQFFLKTHTIF